MIKYVKLGILAMFLLSSNIQANLWDKIFHPKQSDPTPQKTGTPPALKNSTGEPIMFMDSGSPCDTHIGAIRAAEDGGAILGAMGATAAAAWVGAAIGLAGVLAILQAIGPIILAFSGEGAAIGGGVAVIDAGALTATSATVASAGIAAGSITADSIAGAGLAALSTAGGIIYGISRKFTDKISAWQAPNFADCKEKFFYVPDNINLQVSSGLKVIYSQSALFGSHHTEFENGNNYEVYKDMGFLQIRLLK